MTRGCSRAVLAATAVLLLAGCGAAPSPVEGPQHLPSGVLSGSSSGHLSVSDFPSVVLKATLAARSVHAERVERNAGGRTEMTGDTLFDPRHYRGRLTVVTVPAGRTVQPGTDRGEVRLVGGKAYVHAPGMASRQQFLVVDPEKGPSAVAGLCACLFGHVEPTATLQTMEQSLTKVVYLGRDSKAGPRLQHYRLEADSTKIPGAVDAAHPPTTRVYQVWLDSRHRLHRLSYSTTDRHVDVRYSHWGEHVRVQRPGAGPQPSAAGTGTRPA